MRIGVQSHILPEGYVRHLGGLRRSTGDVMDRAAGLWQEPRCAVLTRRDTFG